MYLQVGSYVIDVTVSSLSVPRSVTNAYPGKEYDRCHMEVLVLISSSSSPLIAKAYDATLIKVSRLRNIDWKCNH